ncbi:hypothetical protein JCM10207_008878 [Rhodosporidiobolus poonsookiae]
MSGRTPYGSLRSRGGSSTSRGGKNWRGGRFTSGGLDSEQHQRDSQRSRDRFNPISPPSEAYLAASLKPSTTLPLDKPLPEDHPAPIVVLSLNQTLLFRAKRTSKGANTPLVRPFLSTFLSYLCSTDPDTRKPRFVPVTYSAARAHNVLKLLAAVDLIPPERLPAEPYSSDFDSSRSALPYLSRKEEGDVLECALTRESMGLSEADYEENVRTTKQLSRVWDKLELGIDNGVKHEEVDELSELLRKVELGGKGEEGEKVASSVEEGAKRTVLLDDEVESAAEYPHSLLPVTTFSVPLFSMPAAPPFRVGPTTLELPPSHPQSSDAHLLTLVYLLHRLRYETNVAAALKGGFVERVRVEVRAEVEKEKGGRASEEEIEERMVKRGREVCEQAGVKVKREWNGMWRKEVLEKAKA